MRIYSDVYHLGQVEYRYNYLHGRMERLEYKKRISDKRGLKFLTREKTITNEYPISAKAFEKCPGFWASLAESKI